MRVHEGAKRQSPDFIGKREFEALSCLPKHNGTTTLEVLYVDQAGPHSCVSKAMRV